MSERQQEDFFKNVANMNQIEQVYFINHVFGNDNSKFDKNKIINQAKNLYDELDELVEAYANNDRKEIADAYGDLLTFGYGVGFFMRLESKPSDFIIKARTMDFDTLRDQIKSSIDRVIDEVELQRDTVDAYHKLIAAIHGIGILFSVDSNKVMQRVTESNLTKLCFSYEEMINTTMKYEGMGVDVYAKHIKIDGQWVFVVYSSKEQTVKGKVYRKDKFLKSIYFKEPHLDDLI